MLMSTIDIAREAIISRSRMTYVYAVKRATDTKQSLA